MKTKFLVVFVVVLVLGSLVACKGIDPCDDPMLGGDCYYLKHDPSYATAQAAIIENDIAIAHMTAEALATPFPTFEPTVTPGPLSTTSVSCAYVTTNLYRAIIFANGGTDFPPETFAGMLLQVGYKQNDAIVVKPIAEAMEEDPILQPGDKICIGPNPDVIVDAMKRP